MNYNKLFKLAKEKGISALTVTKDSSSSKEIALFHGEISNYTMHSNTTYQIRGIYNGKFGAIGTESEDIEFILNEIIKNAKVIEKEEEAEIFKGSKSYKKRNYYSNELESWDMQQPLNKLYELEKKVKESDPRVVEVEVEYSYTSSESEIRNSYGLKLRQKNNYYVCFASVVMKDGDEIKDGFCYVLSNDIKEFDVDKLAKETVFDASRKLHGVSIKSKKYRTVLDYKAVASLLNVYISWANADQIQKNSSRFIGKLNTQVASKKLTILEMPLLKNINSRGFDDEGVATYNKKIIDKGVLKTYLHNLETAKKDGVEPTGNGYGSLDMGVSTTNLTVKPGKASLDELLAKANGGVYITSVTGLHAGMNGRSGNFSLQAQGFTIEDGKIGKPLKMITVAGNLLDLFGDVQAVGKEQTLTLSGVLSAPLLIKKLAVTSE